MTASPEADEGRVQDSRDANRGPGTSDPIVYVDQSTVRGGKLDDLKAAMDELSSFVEANEPEILAYNVYFSADGDRMTVMHMHADSASLKFHMEVAGPRFPPIGEFIRLEAIDVYGQPDEAIVQQLRDKAAALGTGSVSVHDLHHGFDRVIGDRA